MKKYVLENIEYELLENYKDGFDYEETKHKYTDYFYDYDYIIGDWAYSKLRLKGFYKAGNKKCNKINDFSNHQEYIEEHCAYECRYFILRKMEKNLGKNN